MTRPTIAERAEAFHDDHPEVLVELRELALRAVRAGHTALGIGQLFEVLRWETMLRTSDADGYKLNNDYRAWYARRLMATTPELDGIFEVRESAVDRTSQPQVDEEEPVTDLPSTQALFACDVPDGADARIDDDEEWWA